MGQFKFHRRFIAKLPWPPFSFSYQLHVIKMLDCHAISMENFNIDGNLAGVKIHLKYFITEKRTVETKNKSL